MNDSPIALCENVLAENVTAEIRSYSDLVNYSTQSLDDALSGDAYTGDVSHSCGEKIQLAIELPTPMEIDMLCFLGEYIDYAVGDVVLSYVPHANAPVETSKTISAPKNRGAIILNAPITAQWVYVTFNMSIDSPLKFFMVYAGKGIRMPNRPLRPYSKDSLGGSFADFESDAGILKRHVYFNGRTELSHTFLINSDGDEVAFKKLYADTDNYSKPFFWVEQPESDPNSPYYMFAQPGFAVTYNGPIQRSVSLDLIEQGPRFAANGI